ncbi:hypothetical protein [Providencia stuartii]|uniref:hypothetical protein n=1 Tax=Providencia stuartii TaxID=588 RepID=UPI00300C369B
MLNIEGGFSGGIHFGLKSDHDMVGLIAGYDGLKLDYKFEFKVGAVEQSESSGKGGRNNNFKVNDSKIKWKLLEGDFTLAPKMEGNIPIYNFKE